VGAPSSRSSGEGQPGFPDLFTMASVLGAGIGLGANSSLTGRYAKNDLFAFTKYKRDLNGIFKVDGPWHKISKIPGLNRVNSALGVVDLVNKGASFMKNPSLGDGVDLVAGGLKSVPSPVTYLAGMAVSSVKLAAEPMTRTDFSLDGFKNIVDAVHRDGAEKILIGGAAPALEQFLTKDIWTIF
jgi:hypothetical protein